MRTQFHVALFHTSDDPTPFATIPVLAKMPLGALVFAMGQAHETRVARVVVAWEDEEQADSHDETDFDQVSWAAPRSNMTAWSKQRQPQAKPNVERQRPEGHPEAGETIPPSGSGALTFWPECAQVLWAYQQERKATP